MSPDGTETRPRTNPGVLQDLQVNDFAGCCRGSSSGNQGPASYPAAPWELPRTATAAAVAVLAGTAEVSRVALDLALLFTCVGAPLYRSSPGGAPGAPTTVRMIRPLD